MEYSWSFWSCIHCIHCIHHLQLLWRPFVGFSNLAELVRTWDVSRGHDTNWNILDVDKSNVLHMFVSRFCFLSWSLGICSQRPRCVFRDPIVPCLQHKMVRGSMNSSVGSLCTGSWSKWSFLPVLPGVPLGQGNVALWLLAVLDLPRVWSSEERLIPVILWFFCEDDKVSIHYFNPLVQTDVVSPIINLLFGVIKLPIYGHIWDGL